MSKLKTKEYKRFEDIKHSLLVSRQKELTMRHENLAVVNKFLRGE